MTDELYQSTMMSMGGLCSLPRILQAAVSTGYIDLMSYFQHTLLVPETTS